MKVNANVCLCSLFLPHLWISLSLAPPRSPKQHVPVGLINAMPVRLFFKRGKELKGGKEEGKERMGRCREGNQGDGKREPRERFRGVSERLRVRAISKT